MSEWGRKEERKKGGRGEIKAMKGGKKGRVWRMKEGKGKKEGERRN